MPKKSRPPSRISILRVGSSPRGVLLGEHEWRVREGLVQFSCKALSMGDVVITVVPDEVEADMVCGMLAANGIRGWYQKTNAGAAIWTGTMATIGPVQVLVDEKDVEEARSLLGS